MPTRRGLLADPRDQTLQELCPWWPPTSPLSPRVGKHPAWSCCFPEMQLVLRHPQPKKHREEKRPWPTERREAMPAAGWDDGQQRGAARQVLSPKVGATPSQRVCYRNQDPHGQPMQRPVPTPGVAATAFARCPSPHKAMPRHEVRGWMPTRNALSQSTAPSLP